MRYARIASLLICCSVFTACSTYVNIPPQSGDVAINNPNMKDVLNVEAVALRAVVADRSLNGGYNIQLPEGTDDESYGIVIAKLDEHAGRAGDGALPTLTVAQVRVRGMKAEVDVVRPSDAAQQASPEQLVTVYLNWHFFDGWMAERVRPWLIPIEKALMQTHTLK